MNHLKRKLEKLTNEQLKHVCNKMGVKYSKSKKLTIDILLKPFFKKYISTPKPKNFQSTSRKMGENFLLWKAVPGLGRPLPTIETRVYGLLSGQHQFDETDIDAIEYLINNRVSDQDKPIYELNRYIIQYHVNNPTADIEKVLRHMGGKKIKNKSSNNNIASFQEKKLDLTYDNIGTCFLRCLVNFVEDFDGTDIEAIEYLIDKIASLQKSLVNFIEDFDGTDTEAIEYLINNITSLQKKINLTYDNVETCFLRCLTNFVENFDGIDIEAIKYFIDNIQDQIDINTYLK